MRDPQLCLSQAALAENHHLHQILHGAMAVFGSHLDGVPIELLVVMAMATLRETSYSILYFLHLKPMFYPKGRHEGE